MMTTSLPENDSQEKYPERANIHMRDEHLRLILVHGEIEKFYLKEGFSLNEIWRIFFRESVLMKELMIDMADLKALGAYSDNFLKISSEEIDDTFIKITFLFNINFPLYMELTAIASAKQLSLPALLTKKILEKMDSDLDIPEIEKSLLKAFEDQ